VYAQNNLSFKGLFDTLSLQVAIRQFKAATLHMKSGAMVAVMSLKSIMNINDEQNKIINFITAALAGIYAVYLIYATITGIRKSWLAIQTNLAAAETIPNLFSGVGLLKIAAASAAAATISTFLVAGYKMGRADNTDITASADISTPQGRRAAVSYLGA